jgi:SAM-dependent methyltransferase
MGATRPSLQEQAREIFGDDEDAIRKWVDYWQRSRDRNGELLESFDRLALLYFPGKRVLDIGCGTGGLGDLIGDSCELYVGADYNLHVLQFADPGLQRKYLQCDGVRLPFRDGVFDYIFAFDVLEHVQGGDALQIQFLRELKRVVRPSGMIFLTTPNFWYPYEGHSRLYFPQYLPTWLADRYARLLNPAFIREHNSFDEIRMISPRKFRRFLANAGLSFLHELPCALDRREATRGSLVRGVLAHLGLGWYPHAEFWGILTRAEARDFVRHKLRKTWFYEWNQPSSGIVDFRPRIDFQADSFGYQLGPGWHWHEKNGRGCRWMKRQAICYLEAPERSRCLRVDGYSPAPNRLEVRVSPRAQESALIGEHFCQANEEFSVEYLIPFRNWKGALLEVNLMLDRTFRPEDPDDARELGAMIFRIEAV